MSQPTGVPIARLNRIYFAVEYLANLEGQDQSLVPVLEYVKQYCDVIDGPEDAERIAADI